MTDPETTPAVETPPAPPAPQPGAPGTTFTIADIKEARQKDPKQKIPTLELTYEDAEILDLADEAIIKIISLKQLYKRLHLVPTDLGVYAFKTTTRTGWRDVVMNTAQMASTRERVLEETGGNEMAAETILSMIQEDHLVDRFLVMPEMTLEEIRQLPPGEVKTLYDSLSRALGYGQPIRAIRV